MFNPKITFKNEELDRSDKIEHLLIRPKALKFLAALSLGGIFN